MSSRKGNRKLVIFPPSILRLFAELSCEQQSSLYTKHTVCLQALWLPCRKPPSASSPRGSSQSCLSLCCMEVADQGSFKGPCSFHKLYLECVRLCNTSPPKVQLTDQCAGFEATARRRLASLSTENRSRDINYSWATFLRSRLFVLTSDFQKSQHRAKKYNTGLDFLCTALHQLFLTAFTSNCLSGLIQATQQCFSDN